MLLYIYKNIRSVRENRVTIVFIGSLHVSSKVTVGHGYFKWCIDNVFVALITLSLWIYMYFDSFWVELN